MYTAAVVGLIIYPNNERSDSYTIIIRTTIYYI